MNTIYTAIIAILFTVAFGNVSTFYEGFKMVVGTCAFVWISWFIWDTLKEFNQK